MEPSSGCATSLTISPWSRDPQFYRCRCQARSPAASAAPHEPRAFDYPTENSAWRPVRLERRLRREVRHVLNRARRSRRGQEGRLRSPPRHACEPTAGSRRSARSGGLGVRLSPARRLHLGLLALFGALVGGEEALAEANTISGRCEHNSIRFTVMADGSWQFPHERDREIAA